MIIIKKEPGGVYYVKDIENTLEAMQAEVGGYIETVRFLSDVCIVCNEEGRLKGMEYNDHILGIDFVGPIFFVGTKGEEFTDCPAFLADVLGVEVES